MMLLISTDPAFRAIHGEARFRAIAGRMGLSILTFSARVRRGRVAAEPPPEPGNVRITIRLDEDLVDYFGAIAGVST
jgi:hypothetical protein